MTKRMHISGYLIVQLEGQLLPLDAIRELVENALDANATNIDVKISSGSMTIIDNGDGTDDPNLIATPSASMSRHKGGTVIGSKAAGAKQALARFGRTWDIHTVPKDKNCYHRYRLTWDPEDELPEQYDPKSKQPVHNAPAVIRHGGTMITVTDRQEGVSNIRLESLRLQLEESYRPALNGTTLSITISDPEKGERRRLSNSAMDQSKFSSPTTELSDKVDGRPFSVRYGALKAKDDILSGCHFIFGPRVVQTVGEIGNRSLPSACYIDVTLGEKWKMLLSTNKNRFRYREQLTDKLSELLGQWIEQQAAQARSFAMKLLNGKAATLFNDSVVFLNKELAGEHGGKPVTKSKKRNPPAPPQAPTPPKYARNTRPFAIGDFGLRKEIHPQCLMLEIEADDKLDDALYRISMVPGKVIVGINTGEKQRTMREIYTRNRNNPEVEVFKVAVLAYAQLAATNKTQSQFAPLWKALQKVGYNLDENSNDGDIVSKVSNFFIDAQYDRMRQRVAA